jgi:hypothetical protein
MNGNLYGKDNLFTNEKYKIKNEIPLEVSAFPNIPSERNKNTFSVLYLGTGV